MVALKRERICTVFTSILTFWVKVVIVEYRGPLISPAAKARVEGLIQSCVDEGGRIHLDGRGIKVEGYENGNFVGPTILEASVTQRCYKYVQVVIRT
jgi:Aldehyde dehydrogenase family